MSSLTREFFAYYGGEIGRPSTLGHAVGQGQRGDAEAAMKSPVFHTCRRKTEPREQPTFNRRSVPER